MIPLLAAAALAADPSAQPPWEDPIAERAPVVPSVALGEGLVFGATSLSFTDLRIGAPLHRVPTFGVGVTADVAGHALWVPSERRAALVPGQLTGEVSVWGSPRAHPGTYHAFVVGGGVTLTGSDVWFVHTAEAGDHLELGYSGYYDASRVDVSFDARLGLGTQYDSFPIIATSHLGLYWPTEEGGPWALAGGATASPTTMATWVGARWRPTGRIEAGAAIVVPVYEVFEPIDEVPAWPVLDVRGRF